MIECNTCKTQHKPIPLIGTDQARGCAATLYLKEGDYYVLAYFGSRFDMQRYMLKKGHYELGNICDECINSLITEGTAHLIEDGVW